MIQALLSGNTAGQSALTAGLIYNSCKCLQLKQDTNPITVSKIQTGILKSLMWVIDHKTSSKK